MNRFEQFLRSVAAIVLMTSVAATGLATIPAARVASLPGDHAHLTVAPRTVTLTFAAPIDCRNATFKVYRFPLEVMMLGDKPMSGAQMDVFAGQEARRVLALKTDTTDRMDTGLLRSASSSQVVIGLKPNLRPGVYVTAWTLKGPGQKTGFVHFHYASY